jgi:hypothetical protein
MKELQDLKADQTEVHAQRQQEKKLAYHGSFRLHPGQKVWECNVATQEIREAEYAVGSVSFADTVKNSLVTVRHSLIMKEGCLYAPAINKKNARDKFVKMLFAHYVNKA